jgi:hypothetical protein
MITAAQVVPILTEACPSFQSTEELIYVALGDFARHLLELHQRNQTHAFPAVAQAIERLHVEGDHSVKEAATIGLLEGIQNVWSNNAVDPDLFGRNLLPESRKWWDELNAFWRGERRFVGEGLQNKAS